MISKPKKQEEKMKKQKNQKMDLGDKMEFHGAAKTLIRQTYDWSMDDSYVLGGPKGRDDIIVVLKQIRGQGLKAILYLVWIDEHNHIAFQKIAEGRYNEPILQLREVTVNGNEVTVEYKHDEGYWGEEIIKTKL